MNLKTVILLFSLTITFFFSQAQPGTWTWIKGDSTAMSPGSFGTAGIPSPTNEPPGRYACSHWTDTSNHFWIYGADFSDMWMFDPVTTMWTFMKGDTVNNVQPNITGTRGVYNATNDPGVTFQGKCTWVTPDNHLWLMGDLNNLWQYDPGSNQWAWMGKDGPASYGVKGTGTATTMPGDRVETSASWVDNNGNLWLFGGDNGGSFNDMWEYNVSTGIWTWMSGTNLVGNAGTYGTLGTGSVNNIPPARSVNMTWKDNAGNFWLTGGENINAGKYFQDVWQFNPATLKWAWMSGTLGADTSGPVGTTCVAAGANKLGKRWENRAVWKVCDNLIVTHSGQYSAVVANSYNDLWAYIPSLGQWMKMASAPQTGRYGTKNVAAANNFPPGRVGAVGFVDKNQNIWLFGGSTFRGNWFNDLWKYVPDTTCISIANCVTTIPINLQANTVAQNDSCSGSCNGSASVTVTSGTPPYHYFWQPGNDTTSVINNLCVGNYAVTVTDAGGNSVTETVAVTAPAPIQVVITADTTVICSNDSAQICATAGFVSYQWNVGNITNCITTSQAGNYYVTVTDNNHCTAESNHLGISVHQLPPTSISVNGDTLIAYNGTTYQWYLNGNLIPGATSPIYIALQQGSYTVQEGDSNGCISSSSPVVLTGIENPEPDRIQVYPNPLSSGNWNLAVSNRLIGAWVEIFDDAGRLVYRSQIRDSLTQIAPDVASGVYLLKINSGQGNIIQKLVKL